VRHLLAKTNWRNAARRIKKAKLVILFLDYDGTLAPIRKLPHLARLSSPAKRLLRRLIKNSKIEICIVSGRSLAEIKRMVGLKNLLYVGNHGLEIEEKNSINTPPHASDIKRRIKSICGRLKIFSRRFPGFWVENKGLTASLHYRLVPPSLTKNLTKELSAWLKNQVSDLRVTTGKNVWEIRPRTKRNKGWAVGFVSRNFRGQKKIEIYAGDDRTDWDAFKIIIKRQGIAIQIGTNGAIYKECFYLKSPGEVTLFMEKLSAMLKRLNSKPGKSTRRIYARES